MPQINFNVILLGLIQGLTEFLPVSSSGHLALAQIFLGTNMPPLSYDLVLHAATACATVVFFWSDIWDALISWARGFVSRRYRRSSGWHMGWAVILGTVITGVIGIAGKTYAESAMQNSLAVGLGLCFTGVVLILSRFIRRSLGTVNAKDGFAVGLAQGIAILPGISRSGMTIAGGLLCGLDKEEAFRLSFFLSLPAIFGGMLLHALDIGGWDAFVSTLPVRWYYGAAIAFISGLLSLIILKKLVISSKWWVFGVYCLAVGAATVVVSYLGVW